MSKKESMSEAEFTEFYSKLMGSFDGCVVNDIVHILCYCLADVAFGSGAPKKDFIAHIVEVFDDAYAHCVETSKQQKGLQ